MARINRSEFNAHAAIKAGANHTVAARKPAKRNTCTLADVVARLPRLFMVAASITAVIVVACTHA